MLTPKTPADFAALRRQVILRRRRLFTALLATAGVTLLGGLLPTLRGLLVLHIAVDLSLVGFIIFLLQMKPGARPRHAIRRAETTQEPDGDEVLLAASGEARRHA